MITHRAALPLLVAVLAVAGCSPATTATPQPTPTPGGSGGGSILDLTQATAAKPVASDKTVTINPKLYTDVGDPCAGITTTALLGDVSPPCAAAWIPLGAQALPGQDIITNMPTPKSVSLSSGIPTDQGRDDAGAFYAANALETWAIGAGMPAVIVAIDGPARPADALLGAVTVSPVKTAAIPTCAYPTSIRIAAASSDIQAHMISLGWPQPSGLAAVVTYAACDGISLTGPDGTTHALLGHKQAVSIVITGHVAPTPPFGVIWVTDGWAPCGAADLRTLCGTP